MILRGIDFGYVVNASGARGFFGEGYWFHRYGHPFGLSYAGSTFVAKTTTLRSRAGNLPLDFDGITPVERLPRCIKVKLIAGVTLNAVDLSGPGAERLLSDGRWQQRREPFFLSFMAVTSGHHLTELWEFVELLGQHLRHFHAPVGLELNFSCPNAGLNPRELIDEVEPALNIAALLGIPLVPKLNATVPVEPVVEIAKHRACDAVHVSNTIPWGQLSDLIDWEGCWGTTGSPLAHLGGGGLSGPPLLPIVGDWIQRARRAGLEKPIIGGGGIISRTDVDRMVEAGADAISLGTVSIVRPWRVQGLIRYANDLLDRQHRRSIAAIPPHITAQ